MCLKISQQNFRSGDLLIYITSRLIWYVWYVMQAKCWWPYLGHKINSQCNRVWHNTLPPYAASRWLCYLFIAIPTSQGMPTNMIEIFLFVTDRVDIMCSVHILSADTTQRPWALLLVFAARRILLPSPQLWFVPSRFQPCLTNLLTVKRPFHVGWFCSRVSVLNNICYRQGVIWFHVNVL